MKKTILQYLILGIMVAALPLCTQAELMDWGPEGEYFYDTESDLYWWDPNQFENWSRNEIDDFISASDMWHWATSNQIDGLVGKSSQGGIALTEVMGPHQFQTAAFYNDSWHYGSRWIGYYDNPPGEPNGWTVQTILGPPADDPSTLGDSGFQGNVENWTHGAWVNSLVNPVDSITITSNYTKTPPTIDGVIGFGEWSLANKIELEQGFITFLNDRHRLYVLIDLKDDTGDDGSDYFWLSFDVDRDGAITPRIDLNYNLSPSTGNMRYQYYLGPGSWTGLQSSTFSSKARGFGCFFADGTRTFGLIPGIEADIIQLPIVGSCHNHRVWELGIDLMEISAKTGDIVRLGLRVNSSDPAFTDNMPENFSADFSQLIGVQLATPADFIIFPSRLARIDLESNALEVTQAIQTRTNDMPLVANKKTVARVYADTDISTSSQPCIVSLYGSKFGVDLPGSPIARLHHAPTSIDREKLFDTANFKLPVSWQDGTVTFQAVVRSLFGIPDSSADIPLTFTPKEAPTFWIVPVNSGTTASPVLPTSTEIAAQESYAKAIFPVPDINFVRRPWQDIGPTSVSNTISELNDFYGEVFIAWIFGLLFTGSPPFDLPAQVYGFNTSGGGLSDPEWVGGIGVVARGYIGSSREGTMAHEMTHNLGPGDCNQRPDGMWGRHVSSENKLSVLDDPTGQCIAGELIANYGCNAAGPDPDWQDLFNDDEIGEVGFDTREAWSTAGSRLTVVPAVFPDYMSYCQSEDLAGYPANQLPTKWISPYRWNRLFDRFATVADASTAAAEETMLREKIELVLYVTGEVFYKGGGNLRPIKVAPGIPDADFNREGPYAIELLGAKGELLQQFAFNVAFADPEGNRREIVPFHFQIPFSTEIREVRLVYKVENILDVIKVSLNAPEVKIVSPNGGEVWKDRLQVVTWLAQDRDGDTLDFSLFYSNDEGRTWLPLASNPNVRMNPLAEDEYSYEVDRSALPGGDPEREGKSALIRIMATDGYHTVQDDSDEPFAVPSNPPVVEIISPAEGDWYRPGETILFRGIATDTEDESIPADFYGWTYDGQAFGTGPEAAAVLPEGYHEISLTVYDSEGMEGSDSIEILVAEICRGDFDKDGDVDGANLRTMSTQIGCKGECVADFDDNQVVNESDTRLFAGDYGRVNCPILP